VSPGVVVRGGLDGLRVGMAREAERSALRPLSHQFVAPDLARPCVLRHGCEEHDDGLVVHSPSGKPLPIEGPFELCIETLGVLAHPIQPGMLGARDGHDPQILAAVEPRLRVVGHRKQGFPPRMSLARGRTGEGVSTVELVTP
jgi:hypothetical protein